LSSKKKQQGWSELSSEKKSMKNKKKRSKKRSVIVPLRKQSFAEKATRSVEQISSLLAKQTSTLSRDIKTYFSSDFEVLLLRMTRPDDDRSKNTDVAKFLATIESFVRDLDEKRVDNPYRVTLRKLWSKLTEEDGRTVGKALFLLHTLLRYCEPEDVLIFKTLIQKMKKEKCSKALVKMFNADKVRATNAETAHLSPFLARYFSFIMKRSHAFTSSFEEMKMIDYGMEARDICAQLMKGTKVIDSALLCRPSADEECEVTISCLELVARDLRDLFLLFHSKLRWLVREEQVGDIFTGWPENEVRAVLAHLKDFYNSRYEEVRDFLLDLGDVLRLYKINIPTSLDVPAIFDEAAASEASTSPSTTVSASTASAPTKHEQES